jgi:hypothetical protein
MNPETKLRVAELDDLTIGQLASKYETLFGEQCRSRNRRYLHRRVAWKLQANDEGGLSQRAILRAGVIADESLIRVTPPKGRSRHQNREPLVPDNWDRRLPPPGNLLERRYKGRTLRVLVLTDGFEYDGEQYKSLTAVAKAITGSHCNGFLFLKLGSKK